MEILLNAVIGFFKFLRVTINTSLFFGKSDKIVTGRKNFSSKLLSILGIFIAILVIKDKNSYPFICVIISPFMIILSLASLFKASFLEKFEEKYSLFITIILLIIISLILFKMKKIYF